MAKINGQLGLFHLTYRSFYTPLKLNMEPEKTSPEKDIPFGNHHFQVPAVKFRGSNHTY